MKDRIIITMCCLIPFAASANPVTIDGSSAIAFGIVAFWALLVEAGIVALLLLTRGLLPLQTFLGYFLLNVGVFLFLFNPLLARDWPVPLLELLVVCADGLGIMFLARLELLQSGNYRGVNWFNALIISAVGNSASFFIGVLASHKPWIAHEAGE